MSDAPDVVERVDPQASPDWLVREHVERYRFATSLTRDARRVLDVACGDGYGSRMIAESGAREVVGVDLDARSVARASDRHAHPSVQFRQGDAQSLDGLADGSFSHVVSFETLEHVPDARAFLGAVRRVLEPGGTFVVSTPNLSLGRLKDQLTGRPSNPFHVREYRPHGFRRLIGEHFAIRSLHGQNFIHPLLAALPVQVMAKVLLAKLKRRELQGRLFYHGSGPAVAPWGALARPRYMIAVCEAARR